MIPSTAKVHLVHWDAVQAKARAAELRAAGYRVASGPFSAAVLRSLRARPPAAVVIDLSRSPSQGRDAGVALRLARGTRRVPLVFVGGGREESARIRAVLPDAACTSWARLRGALARALSRPAAVPAVPASVFAGYSGTPLPAKLGIKTGAVVALVGAPPDFERTLEALPAGVRLRRAGRGPCDLAMWFPRSLRDLERRVAGVAPLAAGGGLWIAWPKRASGVPTDLSESAVRRAGLAAGLVDYKVCAIDATWSGLKFAVRKPR
jgi:hypothetical protein